MSDKKYTVAQLKKICKDKKIKGYSKLKKAQLVKKCLDRKSPAPKRMSPSDLIDYKAEEAFLRKNMKPGDELKYRSNGKPYVQHKKMTVAQLKKECKKNGVKGYSKMKKAELMKKCLKNKSPTPAKKSPSIQKAKQMVLVKKAPSMSKKTPSPPKRMSPSDLIDYDAEEAFLRKHMKQGDKLKYRSNGKPYIQHKTPSPAKKSPPLPPNLRQSPMTPKNNSLDKHLDNIDAGNDNVTEEYELKNEKSNKFWRITYNKKTGGDYFIEFGRIGCKKCTSQSKNASLDAIKKLIKSKTKKGYRLKGSAPSLAKSPVNKEQSELDKFNKEFNKLKAQNKKLEAKGDYDAMDKLFSKAVRKLQPYILKAKNNIPLAKRIAEIYSKEEQTYSEFIGYGKGYENPEHDDVYDEYIAQYEQW